MPGYISEVDYDGGAASNFVEVVVPSGTDVSAYSLVIYDNDGTVIETFSFGSPTQTIAGQDVYLFDDGYANWVDIHNNEAIALVDDAGTVLQFIAFKDPVMAVEGPANGQSATQVGEHSGGNKSLVTSDGGSSYAPTAISTPGTVPCFGPGTRIATPDGWSEVESLRVGNFVLTKDDGPQPIRWIARADLELETNDARGAPVLIRANSISQGIPDRDLVLSPNHRVLLGGSGQFDGLLAGEALAPAKALTCLPSIRRLRGRKHVSWYHFAFERHAIVMAEGLLVESLLIGEMVIAGLGELDRRRIRKLFPNCAKGSEPNGPTARPILSVQQAKNLLRTREICKLFHDPEAASMSEPTLGRIAAK